MWMCIVYNIKCGIRSHDGNVDPSGFQFLTWGYKKNIFTGAVAYLDGLGSLESKIKSSYSNVDFDRIVYIDSKEDEVSIPADCLWETAAALELIKRYYTKPHDPVITIFVKLPKKTAKEEENVSLTAVAMID